ncbi:MAG: tetratricopeptide repeat protein [Proteobacteria bacterium]|nr:tetratricopeptide repeat protein [Pseudomonadota bacterium]
MGRGPAILAGATLTLALFLSPGAAAGQSALEWIRRGNQADARGDHARAIEFFTRALRSARGRAGPSLRAVARFNRGNTYVRLKRYDRAVADYSAAVRLAPRYANAFFNRALIQARLKRYQDALRDVNQVIRLRPGQARAYLLRGGIYGQKKKYRLALRDFSWAIRLDPKNGQAYALRAVTYQKLGQTAKARADLERARRLGGSGRLPIQPGGPGR